MYNVISIRMSDYYVLTSLIITQKKMTDIMVWSSIELLFVELDDQGLACVIAKTINIWREILKMGKPVDSVNRLARENGLTKDLW